MTNNLNTVLLEGKLKNKPEMLANRVCEMTILNTVNDEDSEFNAVVAGNVAETCMKVLKKGSEIRLVGKLRQFNMINHHGLVSKTQVLVEHIEFIPKVG